MKRVVVTGYGVISSLGNEINPFWDNILGGRSGIKSIQDSSFSEIPSRIAGYIEDFPGKDYFNGKELNKYDLFVQYAYAAAKQAVEMANVQETSFDQDRVGIYVGSGIGGIKNMIKNHEEFMARGNKRVSPFMVPMMISNMAAGIIAIKTGFKGPSFSPVAACATSNQAIGEGFLSIRHGYTDAVIAGGAEASINAFAFSGFTNMRAMSTNNEHPQQASRPFDKLRDGFVMSEGSGILFLEELEHAQNRGAEILGEIVGYGSTTDACHITNPDYHGAERSMKLAIEMAGITPKQVDYINAHATGTAEGDKSETKAIKAVFKEDAYQIKINATKSMTGHLFGAAGGIEAIITLKVLKEGMIPPTINLTVPDEDCDLDYVPNKAIKHEVNYAVSNGFGFGGHNASLLFKKYQIK
ncbi:3-oxoacyl-(acyl-carrier-protein) synthase II [Syntrophobotulus glycolicus DSM 8271]|uniref:3-oxoacyl-[acyl-carrier-protein] synthase 2 n=1 Tax=Syntrophobotulus glycolicus (strain DSM 8271 / FlGlyR) TaxID=645991 RepID=F0SUI6_SYNGF|nr:beta-ketoacyl-ACP synthase II [Syntrophobotulus glycolicus]ADY55479.1 3-oxoacyl-(acyl-carrier-protein) synthase II [Syntrophobotulus glycolicus DSM 8271]